MSNVEHVEHPLVQLARQAIEVYVREGRILRPPVDPTPEMQARAGVFVSLHRQGQLRGCIGSFSPTHARVADEIIASAIASASEDPRFDRLARHELGDLEISVDVLSEPEPVTDANTLDPKRYGLIVQAGRRRGLLLPDLEGVDTVADQIDICRRKGGIASSEPVQLSRFTVTRYR